MNSFASASASNLGLLALDLDFCVESGWALLLGVVFVWGLFPFTSLWETIGVLGVLGVLGVSLFAAFFVTRFSSKRGLVPVKRSEYVVEPNLNLSWASFCKN